MIRRLRLFSGLVMLAYVTMHFLNHAVGLISLEAMEMCFGTSSESGRTDRRSCCCMAASSFITH